MKEFISLGQLEKKRVREWFKERTGSKLLVMVGVLVVLAAVMVFLGVVSWSFFSYLREFDFYGFLTAEYLVRSAVVIVMWMGILSGLVANIVWWWRKDGEGEYLLSLPLSGAGEIGVQMIKGVVMNAIFLGVILAPMGGSYLRVFGEGQWWRLGVLMLLLAIVGQAIGSFLAAILSNLKKRGRWIGLGLLVGITAGIVYLIWPQGIRDLYEIEIGRFEEAIKGFYVYQDWVVVSWWSDWLGSGVGKRWWAVVSSLLLLGVSFWWQVRVFFRTKWSLNERVVGGEREKERMVKFKNKAMMKKDWLGVIRVGSELVYGLVILGMIGVFSLLVRLGTKSNQRWVGRFEQEWMIISLVWILFLGLAYALRIIFPLMAKEGKTRWWLFSMPMSKRKIKWQKVGAALGLILPVILGVVGIWWIMPFERGGIEVVLMIIGGMLVLTGVNVGLGMVNPAYELADKPDEVSTTSMGWVTVVVSLLLIAVMVSGVWWSLS